MKISIKTKKSPKIQFLTTILSTNAHSNQNFFIGGCIFIKFQKNIKKHQRQIID